MSAAAGVSPLAPSALIFKPGEARPVPHAESAWSGATLGASPLGPAAGASAIFAEFSTHRRQRPDVRVELTRATQPVTYDVSAHSLRTIHRRKAVVLSPEGRIDCRPRENHHTLCSPTYRCGIYRPLNLVGGNGIISPSEIYVQDRRHVRLYRECLFWLCASSSYDWPGNSLIIRSLARRY